MYNWQIYYSTYCRNCYRNIICNHQMYFFITRYLNKIIKLYDQINNFDRLNISKSMTHTYYEINISFKDILWVFVIFVGVNILYYTSLTLHKINITYSYFDYIGIFSTFICFMWSTITPLYRWYHWFFITFYAKFREKNICFLWRTSR